MAIRAMKKWTGRGDVFKGPHVYQVSLDRLNHN